MISAAAGESIMRKSILTIATVSLVATSGMALARRHDDDRRDGPPRAVLFVKDDFGGSRLMVDHPIRKLSHQDFDDKVSSIRILGGAWQVCVDDDFNGRCEILDHSIRRLSDIHMDDKISSIRPVGPRDGGWNR
jgi:hypothetical protein